MKSTAILITICLGLIILGGYVLLKEPAHGRSNLGEAGLWLRKAAPLTVIVASVMISFIAIKLKWLSIIGNLLIVGSLAISYILARHTGLSMGTMGWIASFISMFSVIPLGLLLSGIAGVVSLVWILTQERLLIGHVCLIAALMIAAGVAYQRSVDRQPSAPRLVAALKAASTDYERLNLALRLSEINDPEKTALLIALLTDPNPRIREAAVMGLGGRPQPTTANAALPLLKALQRETDATAKEAMIRTIGWLALLADKSAQALAVEILIALLAREHCEAHKALVQITGQHFDQNPETWKNWLASQPQP